MQQVQKNLKKLEETLHYCCFWSATAGWQQLTDNYQFHIQSYHFSHPYSKLNCSSAKNKYISNDYNKLFNWKCSRKQSLSNLIQIYSTQAGKSVKYNSSRQSAHSPNTELWKPECHKTGKKHNRWFSGGITLLKIFFYTRTGIRIQALGRNKKWKSYLKQIQPQTQKN